MYTVSTALEVVGLDVKVAEDTAGICSTVFSISAAVVMAVEQSPAPHVMGLAKLWYQFNARLVMVLASQVGEQG